MEKIKKILSKIWEFIKKYWFILITVITSIASYILGRNRSDADFESIRNQLQQYKQQLQYAETELRSLSGIKSEADRRISELETELQSARESIERIETGFNSDESIIQQSRDIIESTERDIRLLGESINNLRNFIQSDEE